MSAQEKLTATLWDAIQQLTQTQKAEVLLNAAITLIDNGQYGDEVENYIDVYLQTPGLPKSDVEKALLARNNARELSGEQLLAKDLHTLGPSDEQRQLPCKAIHFSTEPAWQRAPPEIWEQVAAHTPNYFLRTWLFLSRFYWDIASRHIFHTIEIDFGGPEEYPVELLCYADRNPIFASRVKSLRTYWHGNYEEMLSLWLQLLKTHLPAFTALRDFECIELREKPAEMVQTLLNTHKDLNGLSLISWSFRRIEIPFDNLRKFSLRTEGHESDADVKELRKVLDRNERTLKHLILGGGPSTDCYWDLAFKSLTINNLTHLDLVEHFFLSHFVLTRIVSTDNLQSLTLCGSFLDPDSASVFFASDRIVNGKHSLMPHLKTFRLMLEDLVEDDSDDDEDEDDDDEDRLYRSIIHFLRKRENLRRLNLGGCVWDSDMIQKILPDLGNLRVFGISVHHLSKAAMKSLVESIPKQVVAIRISVQVSDESLDKYAHYFIRFKQLSFLSFRPPLGQTTDVLAEIATTVPFPDFLGWSGGLYLTRDIIMGNMKQVTRIDVAGNYASWLEMVDVYRRLMDL